MSKEMRKQLNKIMNFGQFINEDTNNGITMLTGISRDKWDTIWKNKNFVDKLTNVTSDEDFALDYSYNFKTGKYEDVYVEISNIPIEAFVSYREEGYEDDNDFHSMTDMNSEEKYKIIRDNSLFLVDLLPYKNRISTKLVEV